MGLRERLDALQPRERKLLSLLVGVFVVIVVLLFPIGISAMLASNRSENEQLREAIDRLLIDRDEILERQAKNGAVLARYKQPAPPLAAFLDGFAKQRSLEVPEFKDRPPVPVGKDYEERATEISIKKVNMLPLVRFLESVAQSGHPISITKLMIRRRAGEDDLWDASLTVSAYHRIAMPTKKESQGGSKEETKAEDE